MFGPARGRLHGARLQPVLLVEDHLLSETAREFATLRRTPLLLPRQHRGSALPDDPEELAEYLAEIALLFIDTDLGDVDRLLRGQSVAGSALLASGRAARDPVEQAEEFEQMSTVAFALQHTLLGPTGSPPYRGSREPAGEEQLLERLRVEKLALQPTVRDACRALRHSFLRQMDRGKLLDLPLSQRQDYVRGQLGDLEQRGLPQFEDAIGKVLTTEELGIASLRSEFERSIEFGPGMSLDYLTKVEAAAARLEPEPEPFGPEQPGHPELRLPEVEEPHARPRVAHPAVDMAWAVLLAVCAGALFVGRDREAALTIPVLVIAVFALRRTLGNVRFVQAQIRLVDGILADIHDYFNRAEEYFLGPWLEMEQARRVRALLDELARTVTSWRDLHRMAQGRETELSRQRWPDAAVYLDDKNRWATHMEAKKRGLSAESTFKELVDNLRSLLAGDGEIGAAGLSDGALLASAAGTDLMLAAERVRMRVGKGGLTRPLEQVFGEPRKLLADLTVGMRPDPPVVQILAVPRASCLAALVAEGERSGCQVRPRLRSRTVTYLTISESQVMESGWTLPTRAATQTTTVGGEV